MFKRSDFAMVKALANARAGGELKPDFRCEVKNGVAELFVYDVIDAYWGVSAEAVTKELKALDGKAIKVRINSPGGDVFEARAIKTALEAHNGEVTAQIDGLAASAASFLMLAAGKIEAADGAFVMVHNAWSYSIGNKEELRKTADLLDKIDGVIAGDYQKKTGKDAATVTGWMNDETWFTAAEAVENGLIDGVLQSKAAKVADVFDLTAFRNAPKALTEATEEPLDEQARINRGRQLQRLNLLRSA